MSAPARFSAFEKPAAGHVPEPPFHAAWKQSPAWVARSAAIAFELDQQVLAESTRGKRQRVAVALILAQRSDVLTAIRGLAVSRNFGRAADASDEVRQAFQVLAKASSTPAFAMTWAESPTMRGCPDFCV